MSQEEWENLASLLSIAVGVLATAMFWLGWIPRRWIESGDNLFRRLANHHRLWFLLIPIGSVLINLCICLRNGVPHPLVHDEFSYLLAADTFAHGRLTNPTPPFREHFETPHELMRPTYMSKYPPGQGIALAIGQVIAGQPIVGVWLSTALACLAIYWMLLGFVSPSWALLGGMAAVIHPQLIDWSRVYWGGSVAVLGAALLLGAWARLMTMGGLRASAVFGIGLVILANTRPYEGFMLAAVLTVSFAFHAIRNRMTPIPVLRYSEELDQTPEKPGSSEYLRTGVGKNVEAAKPSLKLFIPMAVVLLAGASAMTYCNWRVTGNPLRMPFVEYSDQYDIYPKFWFLAARAAPQYSNPTLRFVHADFEKGVYDQIRTLRGFFRISWYRAGELLENNLKLMLLFLPLMAAIFKWPDRRLRWIWIAIGLSLLGLLAENFVLPHYEAPVTPVFLLLITVGLAQLWRWKPGSKSIGQWLARSVMLGFISGAVMADAQTFHPAHDWFDRQDFVQHDPKLATGKHLIFITYAPLHSLHNEFVFNSADIEHSRMIWARSFGAASDRAVANHFAGRQIWLLNLGGKLELKPYLQDNIMLQQTTAIRGS